MADIAEFLPQKTLEEVDARTVGDGRYDTREDVVARDLERYYAALAAAHRRLDGLFGVQERWLLLDACNGTLFTSTAGWLRLDIRGGRDIGERWHLSGAVENLLDRNYRVHGSGMDSAGANAYLSLQLRW